eukprot:COSAG02_NODE_12644_length_1515_cov_1.098164_2_plen_231_part_00
MCLVLVASVFLDDHWTGSPSEEAFPCSPRGTGAGRCVDLPAAEIAKMKAAWLRNVETVEAVIVRDNGFAWQSFNCIDGTSLQVGGGHCRAPSPGKGKECAKFLRSACESDSFIQRNAVQYTISHEFTGGFSGLNLTNFEMDLAIFLTSRGPYSWLGYGWLGCGCGWSNGGQMPCDLYQRPAALDLDYGTPTERCHEAANGVFRRQWTKANVTVDCNAYTSEVIWKQVTGE